MTKPIAVHLVVADPEAAAAWYRRVFDAEERHRISLPDGQILTVELAIAETTVALSGEYPEQGIVSPKTVDGSCCAFVVDTHDADTVWQRALDAGAEIFRPLADTFWGERFGQVVDPYGHRWGIAQHLRDVPPDEVARAAARIFGATSDVTEV